MTHTITLVTDVHVSKSEALQTLGALLSAPVKDSDPGNAAIWLPGSVVLSIEVPKFGEDLPLTIDLTGPDLRKVTQTALALINKVKQLSWSATIVGEP